MAVPIYHLTEGCGRRLPKPNPKVKGCDNGKKVCGSFLLFDTLVSITALVVGILGVTSVMIMPPAAAYTLIGVSGGITALWIAMIIKKSCFK